MGPNAMDTIAPADGPPAWALPLLAMAGDFGSMKSEMAAVKNDVALVKQSTLQTEARMNDMDTRLTALEVNGGNKLGNLVADAERKFKECVEKAESAARVATAGSSAAASTASSAGDGWQTVGGKRQRATSPRRGRAGRDDDEDGSYPQGATRVVLLGFEKPLLADTLKKAAREMLAKLTPTADQSRMELRAFDLTRKVIIDFKTAMDCSNFLSMAPKVHDYAFIDKAGDKHCLRLRRDM